MSGGDPYQAAEDEMRRLLDEEGLPPPDEVELLVGSISLRWHEQKLGVVIDECAPGNLC